MTAPAQESRCRGGTASGPAPAPLTPVFPGETWATADRPEDLGFRGAVLAEAERLSRGTPASAVIIVSGGRIVREWGDVETRHIMFSARKSFMSALYGRYVEQGVISLDTSLEDLGIDDEPPLSALEKRATVRDILKARSGVYHEVDYGTWPLPPRDSHLPGAYFYYNNWDFNVAGVIFERLTGTDLFQALHDDIAGPIGMEHFRPEDGHRFFPGTEPNASRKTIHPAYSLRMTARDMARFGLLMLRNGRWGTQQVVPAAWVAESTRYHSDATSMAAVGGEAGSGYGYMWWVARRHTRYPLIPGVELPEGTFMAAGAGGHYILIIPERDLVIVQRVANGIEGTEDTNPDVYVPAADFGRLVRLVLEAQEPPPCST